MTSTAPRTSLLLVALGGLVMMAACATGSTGTRDDETPAEDAGTIGTAPRDASTAETSGDAFAQGPRRPVAGEVIFTEMMINPDPLSDEFGEWVELYNTTDAPLSLAQCRLGDEGAPKDDREIDRDVIIPAKSAIVMGRSGSPAINGGLEGVVFEYGNGFVLANTGDSAILTCSDVVIDRVVFTSNWPFGRGATMQLKVSARNAAANDTPGNWCLATLSFGTSAQKGTPGNTQNHCP